MSLTTSAATAREAEDQTQTSLRRGPRLTRRSFIALSAASLGGLALYAGEIARHELSIEEHTVHLAGLPDAFRGMRMVQISDFHYADFTESFFLREVVDHVNRLKPDLVVLTGDFITFRPWARPYARQHMPECAEILSGIQCPLRYATMGNHDAFLGHRWVTGPLRDHGIPVLVNNAAPLERNGQRLWLVGLGSACVNDADPAEAIPNSVLKDKEAMIVLAHEPDILPEVARYGPELMLSGHTHGGQIRFPFVPPMYLPDYGQNYVKGWYRYGPTQLYVNRGIGTVGVPLRLNCPPEVTVFTLA